MAVFKRLMCKTCRRSTWEEKEQKVVPPCSCGGTMAYSAKWYVSLTVLDAGGRKRKLVKAVHPNRRRAEEYEAERVTERSKSEVFGRPRSSTFDDAAKAFLVSCDERVEQGNMSALTAKFYASRVTALLKFFKGRDIAMIDDELIDGYKKARLREAARCGGGKKGGESKKTDRLVSAATVNRELATLSAIFAMLKKKKRVKENPLEMVERISENNNRQQYLSNQQIEALLAACHAPHLRLVVVLALETGLRKHGCISIKWEEIDFQKGVITKEVKGGKTVTIPMTDLLRVELLTWKANQKVRALKGYVIPSPKKPAECMRVDANFGFETACTAAGISDFTFHDLRHTFATHFLERTGDIHTLSDILGHSAATMTERYAHVMDRSRRAAMKKFEEGR